MTLMTETRRPAEPPTADHARHRVPRPGRHPRRARSPAAAGPGEAVIRVTLDDHLRHGRAHRQGEYPVRPGLVIGHEPVGVIEELGPGVTGYQVGDRVLVGRSPLRPVPGLPVRQPEPVRPRRRIRGPGGWRFGNTIDGAQAEYLLVPSAQANLAPIPDGVTDEQVVLLADIASTGFSGAESGDVRIGDAVVVFAQGPIGLWATAGAKLMGASLVIGVDPMRSASRWPAAWWRTSRSTSRIDVVDEVMRMTGGVGT